MAFGATTYSRSAPTYYAEVAIGWYFLGDTYVDVYWNGVSVYYGTAYTYNPYADIVYGDSFPGSDGNNYRLVDLEETDGPYNYYTPTSYTASYEYYSIQQELLAQPDLPTVDITSVGDTTPNENTSDQVTATTTTDSSATISSYAWSASGGITFNSTTVQSPTITFPDITVNTAASITCVVTDSLGATASDTQNYTIQFINQGPLATLSGTQAVLQNEEVSLTASGSYDPDGFALEYQFSTTNGTETFTQAYSASETFDFTPTETGVYTTTVTVKDTSNATATALFSTIVSEAQDPNAGSGGGYGFEVYNAAGDTVIRSDELIIRKVTTVSLDGNGDGSASVTLPDSGTELIASGQSDAETDGGVDYSVSVVNSTATVTIAAPGYTSVDLYMVK